ncbi:MAG: molybdopterin-guanine dinucleotide biosynthesis protein B [Pseudomonadota bacterium]
MLGSPVPVLGFAACSGTGKTTLLIRLIPLLARRGLRIAMIKHAHHDFDIDIPGKDSYELRRAGARQVLVASDRRRALISECSPPREPALAELVAALDQDTLDLVLVEGFRHLPFPKIELHRPALGHPLLCREDRSIIAVASDAAPECGALPVLDINHPAGVADFIVGWLDAAEPRGAASTAGRSSPRFSGD